MVKGIRNIPACIDKRSVEVEDDKLYGHEKL
jgi:hypothetical protein